jgi:hypothetical protein
MLEASSRRSRYGRRAQLLEDPAKVIGRRHGHRSRSLPGTFGQVNVEVPRARLNTPDGKTSEWKSRTLRAAPAPAHRVLAHRAGERRTQRAAHTARVGAGPPNTSDRSASAANAGHSQRFLSAPSCAPRGRLDETRAGRSARRQRPDPVGSAEQ